MSMRKFISFLARKVESFIAFRKASENWNDFYEHILHRFDIFCKEKYPDSTLLSQEMINNWCKQRDTENNNTCRTRIYAVVDFIRYLRIRAETDVNEPILPRKEAQTYIPHAFTDIELADFFRVCDSLPSEPKRFNTLLRRITIPVFFRLLYSSGIRTTEARLLRTENVDLQHGILNIEYSKGTAQHYVVLHESMTNLLGRYDAAVETLCPNRKCFFPASRAGNPHNRHWISENFCKLWAQTGHSYAIAYDIRHYYATTNINKWIDAGFGFDDKLTYLSKSMGHCNIESTKRYYSLVPGLADILKEQTNEEFEEIVPEADYEAFI